MADVRTSEMDARFHQSTWGNEILYADRPSEDEQIQDGHFLWKTRNTNLGKVNEN
jgi:hypothetical protein